MHQQYLINLNCAEERKRKEEASRHDHLVFLSKRFLPQQYCVQPIFPRLPWHDEMHFSSLSIPYPLCSATHSPLRLRKSFRRLPAQTSHLLAVYLLLLVGGMSNDGTTVLITSPHTCTPACTTHLIAPHPHVTPPPLLHDRISAYSMFHIPGWRPCPLLK